MGNVPMEFVNKDLGNDSHGMREEVFPPVDQGPTERSLFQELVPGSFLYFWWVRCSLIQRGNREGIREGDILQFKDKIKL